MTRTSLCFRLFALTVGLLLWQGCGLSREAASTGGSVSYALGATDPLNVYPLLGDTHPVLDPSIMRQGGTFYLFSTDVTGSTTEARLPIRCSEDEVSWKPCGAIFPHIPLWMQVKVPAITGLWAPDISFFNGLYHVYYAGSMPGSQRSAIGLATNTTLDPADAAYRWVDGGEVLASESGDDFNAIDPNVLVDSGKRVYLTYGSYWTGIKQLELDPATGLPLAHTPRHDLASRPQVQNGPIEGASLVRHGGFYYLFVSLDYCCNTDRITDNYKEAVGRSTSPGGPFLDADGTPMMSGGSTVLLEGDIRWNAPGGGTVYIDAATGESLMVFHAHKTSEGGTQYVWLKHLAWENDWPSFL